VICHDKTAGISLAGIHGDTCEKTLQRGPHANQREKKDTSNQNGKKKEGAPVLLNFRRCSSNA
jgi:hypothetical protein